MAGTERRALLPLKGNQAAASAPGGHVWLAASAGTGKTQVLAARVWRLLLHGAKPSAILCLTFTKAGASEMSARITGQLARWVRADRGEVFNDLEALGERADDAMIARARTLFAEVLDAPGGLRIQTIHSFCQSLLASFPLEAGLTPGFRPLEAREEAVLKREALAEMLVDAEREGRGGVVEAIGALSLRLGEGKAEAFLHECARRGEALEALPSGIQPWLRRALDLPIGDISAEIARQCGDSVFDRASLETLLAMNLAWGTGRASARAAAITAWLAGSDDERGTGIAALHAELAKGNMAKGWVPADPGYADIAGPLHESCAELSALQVRAGYADLLAAGLEAGRDYARAYAGAKRRIGGVDFDDLIRATIRLLRQDGMAEWIRFKLDQETEHVLIDEAQDTNAEQWAIIDSIVEEYFAGAGTRGGVRTLFTVGDYKQAIYGFQGTDPAIFRAMLDRYRGRAEVASELIGPDDPQPVPLADLSLTHSFRSTRPVLEFVDAAIGAMPEPAMGALSEPEPHASEVAGPGSVTLWPPVMAGASESDEEQWVAEPVREVAKRIARAVKNWIGTLPMRREGETLSPGDVMILVKRRGELASLIVARLYAEGVPVAGVDRLRLNAPLAVQDLLAAVRFALQPEDELNLASLLVSPLIGWSQDELMAAAAPKRRGGLWRHLRESVASERLDALTAILARADFSTPYQFLEWLLSGPIDGRRRLMARLGAEARDPIEELLNAALNFEKVATPSLQRFLDWFDRGDVEIVRDASQPQDAVRVMTAHGAKGLQAPLVILADATINPGDARRDFLAWSPDADTPPIPVIRPRANERWEPLDALVEEVDRRELEEHWRLFYVAATRAEERLVIAGALSSKDKGVPQPSSWYAASVAAFDALGVPVVEGGERVFEGAEPQGRVKARGRAETAATAVSPLPDWAKRPAPVEARPPRPLAPSSIGEDRVSDPPPGPALRAAAERGRLIHALLERLPAVAVAGRVAAAERWLAGAGGVEDAAVRSELAGAALAVISDPRFAELFGPDALAEAPIAAVVAGGHVVSGTADRLLVTADRVLVVDFKTGRRAPGSLDEVPPYHVRQMAAYVAALEVVFPGRRIEAGLLYTAGPVLFALPDDLLAAHKPGFVGAEQRLAPSA